MAYKRRRRAAARPRRRRARKQVVVVSRTRHRRRRSVGSIGSTRRRRGGRRRSRGIGSTTGTVTSIVKTAAGIAAGVILTNIILRPLEDKVVREYPWIAKFLGGLEILAGGLMAMKMRHPMAKAAGLGIMAGGVNTVMRQFKVSDRLTAIHGPADDYSTVRIPMSGMYNNMVAGMIDQDRGGTFVGNSGTYDLLRTPSFVGSGEDEDYLQPAGLVG